MTPMLRFLVWSATALVVATGGAYAWFAYACEPASPFDVVNHPWQPTTLHAHVLVAPVWLVVTGAVWQAHGLPMLRRRHRSRRRSGILLLVLLVPMAASGYLLQTAGDEAWRAAYRGVHLVTSVAWTLAFVGHVAIRGTVPLHSTPRLRRSAEASPATLPGG